jgi:hypothetical protein
LRVFLSWSGAKSHEVALALKSWLPEVINDLDPWMSSEDIDKGAPWSATIARELEQSNFGIICLTRENQNRVWLNYEAGAIAKAMSGETSRAATFLIDIASDSEVTGPLFQFQSTKPTKDEVLKLVRSLNTAAGNPRTDEQLKRAVEKWWPDLEEAITTANRPSLQTKKPVRTDRQVLDEVLLRVRDITQELSRLPESLVQSRYSSGLREVVQISTQRAFEADLAKILPKEYHPVAGMWTTTTSGQPTFVLEEELPDPYLSAVYTLARQRGIIATLRRGVIATTEPALDRQSQ